VLLVNKEGLNVGRFSRNASGDNDRLDGGEMFVEELQLSRLEPLLELLLLLPKWVKAESILLALLPIDEPAFIQLDVKNEENKSLFNDDEVDKLSVAHINKLFVVTVVADAVGIDEDCVIVEFIRIFDNGEVDDDED
jgi:hypothetical protein